MKHLLPILLCLTLTGCAFVKDTIGGQANVPVGFELTHICSFNYPTKASVVGFRIIEADGPGRCGQVMFPVEKVIELSRNELMELVFAQFLAGMFTPCAKENPDGTPSVPAGQPAASTGDPVCNYGG
jgi:hypothetical protein